jgi:hypothetical protein
VLETRDGQRLPLFNLPDAVAHANGMRVWVIGPLDWPRSAGVIDPNRHFFYPE